MAEMIQFTCPACGTILRLPLAMAALEGPCPHCRQEIVAPDPYRGIGARLHVPVVLKVEPEPFRPFVESPPLVPKAQEFSITREPVRVKTPELEAPAVVLPISIPAAVTETVSHGSQTTILVLSCLLAGACGLAVGFAFGVRTTRYFSESKAESAPFLVAPKPQPEPKEIPERVITPLPIIEPPPDPVLEKPLHIVPKVETLPAPMKVSAAAEASLRAFLEAPDWASRCAYVLNAESVRTAMEAYSHEVADGPTTYKSISVKQSLIDEASGNTLLVFLVITEKYPKGIPVAVKETDKGWLIDWLAFVEFRDGLFQAFADGPANKGGFFHLIVSLPPPAPATKFKNENFDSYLLHSPLAEDSRVAYVNRKSPAAKILASQTPMGRNYTPVLEVVKSATPDKKDYLEILSVKSDDWFPR